IDTKNPSPEAGRLVVHRIVAPQADRLQHDNQKREAHGELWEEIVKRRGEGEVQAVNEKCAVHKYVPRLSYQLSVVSSRLLVVTYRVLVAHVLPVNSLRIRASL